MISRLQFGVCRLERLSPEARKVFLDKSWLHYGDTKQKSENEPYKQHRVAGFIKTVRANGFSYILKRVFQKVFVRTNKKDEDISELYSKTNFQEFHFSKGEQLPFADASIDFIYSEHFFEHLFFDEALALFKECHRILTPGGVIRTIVPDADLRTYEKPEPLGFPDEKVSFKHPDKHKTRWSVYSLGEAVRIAGFKMVPLRYCDKSGDYIKSTPSDYASIYLSCVEKELIDDFGYINRPDSLIIDGIKVKHA